MSVQTEQAPAIRGMAVRLRTWWSAGMAVLVAGGIVLTVTLAASGSHRAVVTHRLHSVARSDAGTGSQLVTGTGPDLVRVAERSAAAEGSQLVTGTGPDLVRVAEQSPAAEGSQLVTGTGPDLARIAKDRG